MSLHPSAGNLNLSVVGVFFVLFFLPPGILAFTKRYSMFFSGGPPGRIRRKLLSSVHILSLLYSLLFIADWILLQLDFKSLRIAIHLARKMVGFHQVFSFSLLTLSSASSQSSLIHESSTEVLVEELIDLHASSPTFRQVFRSQQTTQLFIDAYKAFVTTISSSARSASLSPRTISILEKVSRFALTLTLESDISGPQKRQVFHVLIYCYPDYTDYAFEDARDTKVCGTILQSRRFSETCDRSRHNYRSPSPKATTFGQVQCAGR